MMTQGMLLRRTKASKIDGRPVVELPPRHQTLLQSNFSSEERTFYTQLQAETSAKLKVPCPSGRSPAQHMRAPIHVHV
jgi:SNF2 family DNA or RNA helicase